MASVVVCPASKAHYFESFDAYQFEKPHSCPVVPANFDAEGNPHSLTNLSFNDLDRMSNTSHKLARGRKTVAPQWALNDASLRTVLVAFWERRAHIRTSGSERERLMAAHAKMLTTIPDLLARLRVLSHDFVSCPDPVRKTLLVNQIRNLDSQVLNIRRGPALTLAILTFYYRLALDSVGVAETLHVSSTHVRQQLHRMKLVAARLERGEPVQKVNEAPPKPPETAEERAKRRDLSARRRKLKEKIARGERKLEKLRVGHDAALKVVEVRARKLYEQRLCKAEAARNAALSRVTELAESVLEHAQTVSVFA